MSRETEPAPGMGPLPADWPRPLRLLVALMRQTDGPDGDPDAAGLVPALAGALDAAGWARFADLAIARHRVAPAIAPRLTGLDMPDAVRARLDAAVRQNAVRTLTQIAETRRIRAALCAIGADPVVLKGWPLGARLYGDASARHTGDLDLLVPPGRVWAACAALEALGFGPARHTAKFRRRARNLGSPLLIRACKDIELVHPGTGVAVELHWKLLNYEGWPTLLDEPGAIALQESQAGPLRCLSDRTNLFYLSTHGALHLWDRLKWLADIARLAAARGPALLAEDLAAARAAGLDRPVAFALRLSARLLASPLPEGMPGDDPGIARLERWIVARLARPEGWLDRARYQAGVRWMGLRLAVNRRQTLGVIGYDTARRLRLLSLDLMPPVRAGADRP